MYPQDLIDSILKAADIVSIISSYIPVTKKGRSYVALCPFHDDKHPSLNISSEKQIFKCFSCGTGGNAITFVEKYEKISFEEAVRKVADMVNFHDPRLEKNAFHAYVNPSLTPLYACIEDLEKYYQYALSISEGKIASDYLAERHIGTDQIAKYGLGYAPVDGKKTIQYLQAKGHSLKSIEDIGISLAKVEGMSDSNAGRLIFVLKNPEGQVVGFSARRLADDGSSKYVNSPETKIFQKGKNLYNYDIAKRTAHHDGYVYVLEGFMDVMALEKAGISSAVALMGTNLSSDQITLLRRLNCEIRLCLDGDAPGQEGMMRMILLLNKAGLQFRLVSNPGDLRDPDDILQESGPDALKESMSHLYDAFDFQIDYYTNVKKLQSPEERRKVMMYFIPFLRNVPPGIDRDNYIVKLSKATGYEEKAIRDQVNSKPADDMTVDEISYSGQIDSERLHPEKRFVRRLFLAEREALYYMMENPDAVAYFNKSIDSFYTEPYNRIANFIREYSEKRKEPVSVSSLINDIASSDAPDSDELQSEVTKVAQDNYHPPYSDKSMPDCARAIAEEKSRLADQSDTEKAFQGKTDEEKAILIKEFAARQAERRAKKKNPQ
jgi:DNA primase